MSVRVRKLLLSVHIVVSVGWIGVDAVLLALGITGLSSADPRTVQAIYLVMARLGTLFITPVSLAALLSGIALAVGTRWGLLRHYWVIASLVATAAMAAAAIGLLNPRLRAAADAVAAPSATVPFGAQVQIVVASSVALVLLCTVNGINVYKPRGRTPSRMAGARP